MKNTSVRMIIPMLAAGLLTACSGTKTATGGDSSSVKTDSTQTMSSSPDDSSTAMADTMFATKAAISGMAEVALGKMAAAKGTSKDVKDFGQMMVMDHGKANAELMSIARNKNIPLPAGLDTEHQAKSDSLSKLTGQDFDKGYVAVMIDGHKKTLALMQSEASNGKDGDLKAFAAKTAPVVQHHLEEIQKIQGNLK